MFPFLSKNKKEKFSLIVDIQSGLVRGALVKNEEGKPPLILRVSTKIIPRKTHTNSHYINKMMLKALSEVMMLVTENHHITSIDIVLSSPWVLSHSKTIKVNFPKQTEITEEIVSGLIEEERKKLELKFKTDHKEIPDTHNDLRYIEQKIFDIKLNGYSVGQYLNRVISDLELSLAMTLSSQIILNRINDVISKFTHTKDIRYHSGLLLNFVALRKMMPDKTDYVYIHAHSELTDVIVVKKGLCASISSFPLGTSNLIRKISHSFKQSDEVADSMMSLYQGNKLDETEMKKISTLIDVFSAGWYALYSKTLEATADIGGTPRLMYLSTHSHMDIFKKILIDKNKDEIHINDFSLEQIDSKITFEKISESNQLIKMYALALNDMLQ